MRCNISACIFALCRLRRFGALPNGEGSVICMIPSSQCSASRVDLGGGLQRLGLHALLTSVPTQSSNVETLH